MKISVTPQFRHSKGEQLHFLPCFSAVLTALFRVCFYTTDAKFHPVKSHRGIRGGPDGQERDQAAATGGQLQAGGDTELPRNKAGGSSQREKSVD